jgi:enolase-phosphatase E1
MKAILLDIEGTTTPIAFVHQTLFPFARVRIEKFVETNLDALAGEIEALRIEYNHDFVNQIYGRGFHPDSPSSVAAYLEFLIDSDRKSTPLKSIQGAIWRTGYESGELKSVMFADVAPAFARWHAEGKQIAIFSSGSVLAQKLIFQHSDAGDLTPRISAYFDTNVGAKRESESYERIAGELRLSPAEVLFISDVPAELDAAAEADFKTLLCVRPGNARVKAPVRHDVVGSFGEIGE